MSEAASRAASRTDPRTLVPVARAMYEAGKTRSQVLSEIYGVDLPRETALIHRDLIRGDRSVRVMWCVHPWQLMITRQGGPSFPLGPLGYIDEVRAYAQAPNVLLVGWLCYPRVSNGFSVIGYDLDEVAGGRSTMVSLPQEYRQVPETGAKFTALGPSLVDVLADVIKAYHARWHDREDAAAYEERAATERELAAVEAIRQEPVAKPGAG